MGLIYVNPEGPDGKPDPVASARDVRETFARMAMNDEETVALVAGGHTFGKAHGAGDPKHVGPEPEAAPIEEMGLGWKSSHRSGKGDDTIGSGIEGAWKPNPTRWDMGYLKVLFKYDWELVKSPAGAHQWLAKDVAPEDMVEGAHDKSKKYRLMMTTATLPLSSIRPTKNRTAFPAESRGIRRRLRPAWFKLTHRDMGAFALPWPRGPEGGADLAGPVPAVDHKLVEAKDIEDLKGRILASGLRFRNWFRRAGLGVNFPQFRQARRRQRCARSPDAAEGLGSQPARTARQSDRGPRGDQEEVQRRTERREEGVSGRHDRSGWMRWRRKSGEERGP